MKKIKGGRSPYNIRRQPNPTGYMPLFSVCVCVCGVCVCLCVCADCVFFNSICECGSTVFG